MKLHILKLLLVAVALLVSLGAHGNVKPKSRVTLKSKAPPRKDVKPILTPKPRVPPGYEELKSDFPQPTYSTGYSAGQGVRAARNSNALPVKRRAAVFVPKGSLNVARGKPVGSSDGDMLIGSPAMLTNGDKEAREGSWMELAPGLQWLQIDLQGFYDIHGILLWHFHGEARVYRDVVIQLADDAGFTKNIRTIFNNDDNNSSGLGDGKDREYFEHRQGQWIPLKTQTARYVRFYSNGNTSDKFNQYIEAEVWGTPAKWDKKAKPGVPSGYEIARFKYPPAPYLSWKGNPERMSKTALFSEPWRDPVYLPRGATNMALGKKVTSSDEYPIIGTLNMVTDGEKEMRRVVNGNHNNPYEMWVELGYGTQWVQIDLEKSCIIYGVLLWHYNYEPRVYRDVIVRLADDAAFTKNVRTVFNNDDDNSSKLGKGSDREYFERNEGEWIPIKAQKARFVRLYSRGNTSDPQNQYIEAEVWATQLKATQPKAAPTKHSATQAKPIAAKFVLPPPYSIPPHRPRTVRFQISKTTDVKPKSDPPPGCEAAKFEYPPLPPSSYYGSHHAPMQTTALPYKMRGVVYLPQGAANVARGKPVTSSDAEPVSGTLSQITDGNKNWTEGSWVELGPGTQWVQIDLKKSFIIHGVLLWHHLSPSRVYRDVVIQVADDANFTQSVRTVFNNDQDNSSGLGPGKDREFWEVWEGQWVPIKAQKARYVRLYSRGNSGDPQNHYLEAEVWATPAK